MRLPSPPVLRSNLAGLWVPFAVGLAACGASERTTSEPPLRPEPELSWPDRPPAPCHGHRVEWAGDTLVLFGGFRPGSSAEDRGARETWCWDPVSAAWRAAAPMSRPRAFFGSAVVEGAVVALGEGIERLDARTRTWETLLAGGALPNSHFGAAAIGGVVFAVGGFPAPDGGVCAFDVAARELRAVPAWPGFARGDHFHVVAVHGDELHVVGGLDGERFEPKREHWRLHAGAWERLPDAPAALWLKFAVVQAVDGMLFVFATDSGTGWSCDLRTAVWRERAPLRELLAMPASYARDGWIHVLGGLHVDDTPGSFRYEIAADRWFEVETR